MECIIDAEGIKGLKPTKEVIVVRYNCLRTTDEKWGSCNKVEIYGKLDTHRYKSIEVITNFEFMGDFLLVE